MKKINKPTARKLFRQGTTIYLIPCKIALHNPWITPAQINVEKDDDTFDHLVNAFEWYNCNSECGYYAHYYVMEGGEE